VDVVADPRECDLGFKPQVEIGDAFPVWAVGSTCSSYLTPSSILCGRFAAMGVRFEAAHFPKKHLVFVDDLPV